MSITVSLQFVIKGLSSGGYVYLEASQPRKPGDNAQLLSPAWNPATSTNKCTFTFYYNMNGRTMGTLGVYMVNQNQQQTQLWSTSGNHGDVWVKVQLGLVSTVPFQIVIQGVIGNGYYSDIAIDDAVFSQGCTKTFSVVFPTAVSITTPGPTTNPCGAGQFQCKDQSKCIPASLVCNLAFDCADKSDEAQCGQCNFENGLCGWTDLSNGRYNWTRHSGSQNTGKANGPSTDHTTNAATGNYMYVEGTNGVFFSKAILQSPALPATSNICEMYFWYNMNGANVGTLVVQAQVNSTSTTLLVKKGSQGAGWKKGVAYIGKTLGNTTGLRITFQVLPSRGFVASSTADIAIDDITFNNCNPAAQPPPLACNFDKDFCTWNRALDGDFQWTRKNGTTASVGTGPKFDHTSKKGYYIYIETSQPRKQGQVAILDSPVLPPTPPTGHCLSFWYYMFGPTIGSLNIYLRTNYNRTLFWNRNGTQGDKWIQAQRQIVSGIDYSISIQGVVGKGNDNDILFLYGIAQLIT